MKYLRCNLSPVYTIQPGLTKRLYRVYSRLSNRLYNPVWQLVEQTVAVRTTQLSNRVVQPFWQPCWTNSLFVQHGCQTGLTTGWMFVYTIQPVVKPVVQPVWQLVVSCKRGFIESATFHSLITSFLMCESLGETSEISFTAHIFTELAIRHFVHIVSSINRTLWLFVNFSHRSKNFLSVCSYSCFSLYSLRWPFVRQ